MSGENFESISFPVRRWIFFQVGGWILRMLILNPSIMWLLPFTAVSQDEETMTTRIIKVLEHPQVTMLGHLGGRLLLEE